MRNITVTLTALALVALVVCPAYAAQDNPDVRVQSNVDLTVYDIVIGDMGDIYDSWGDSPTRIRADVVYNNQTSERYFDSLPAALYVMRQQYGEPNITRMDVLDYAGLKLIDSRQAYYVWDHEHKSRGGLPLVLAFSDYQTAVNESLYRNSEVIDYNDVVKAVYSWEAQDRDRIYWRGRDRDQWDAVTWNSAWNNRWQGWGWDHDYGWSKAELRQAKENQLHNQARQASPDGSVLVSYDLSVYDIVIGDMGDKYETWGDSPTRIRADVVYNNQTSERYFDSLPAALYVLRQQYGEPNISRMDVLDYASQSQIDSRQAYYVWDYERQSRGGLPLVLAFSDYQTALAESINRNSEVVDYNGVVKAVYSWEDQDRDRIYWRGRDSDHWDSVTWNSAWNNRWQGWDWNQDYGWIKSDSQAGF